MFRHDKMKVVNRITGLLICFSIAFLYAPDAAAQSSPDLEVDAVAAQSAESEKTRLDVYTRVPYSALRFLSTNDGFRARYGVTIEVHELEGGDNAGNLVQTRMWEQAVNVSDFGQTQTDQLFDRTIQSLEIEPGQYLIEFQIDDEASNRSFVKELAVDVRDMDRPVAISDLILIDAFDSEANSITPTVSNRLGSEQQHFKLFYELYSEEARKVRVTREVVRIRKNTGPPSVKSLLGLGSGDEVANAELSYQETTPRDVRRGRNQYVIEIPLADFRVGDYMARITVEDENGSVLDRAEKPLSLQWTGLADHVRNLDDAIAQLSYIAKRKDVKHIKEAPNDRERLKRFREFWSRRDPTPGTERNERMEEYYYRIAYANRQYGKFGNGWQTDRGQVMVLFGEPDHVDRHPFNFDVKPYEVWYYYQIGRRFIFIDETGVGDYELLVPYWDERTRIR